MVDINELERLYLQYYSLIVHTDNPSHPLESTSIGRRLGKYIKGMIALVGAGNIPLLYIKGTNKAITSCYELKKLQEILHGSIFNAPIEDDEKKRHYFEVEHQGNLEKIHQLIRSKSRKERQKRNIFTLRIQGKDVELPKTQALCLMALRKTVVEKNPEYIRPIYITMKVWPGKAEKAKIDLGLLGRISGKTYSGRTSNFQVLSISLIDTRGIV